MTSSMYSNLDPSQREAVCCGIGPCEIIAGPGSGKTLVLTERILYLLDHYRFAPSQILVLTFSRFAAAEMKERFIKKAGERNQSVRFGTFHSVFFHILKESAQKNYTILGQLQKERLLEHLIRSYYPDENDRPSVEEMEKMLRADRRFPEDKGKTEAVRNDYRSFLAENGYLDFDDMIRECRRLLENNSGILSYWREQFRCILVDEFQDINREQYEVLKLLSAGDGLFVVGDDDQSIYGFRGSSPTIMQQFMQDYPSAIRIFLCSNYRCSGEVCKAAGLMIRQNKIRIPKKIRAVRPMGSKTVLRGFIDDREEYQYLFKTLNGLPAEQLDKAAVIVRTNIHVHRISTYLTERGIPCRGKTSPSSEILSSLLRDLEAYYALALGLKAGEIKRSVFFRVMNRPERYLLRSLAAQEQLDPQALLRNNKDKAGTLQSLKEFLRDLEVLGALGPEGFIRYLTGPMGYAKWAAYHLGQKESVESALSEVLSVSRSARDMDDLLQRLRRFPEKESVLPEKGVRVMTMHACKGLEFDRVYLPALNEGIIPGRRCREAADFEEERRLLYVAMTRARDHLEMLYVTGTKDNPRPPSRFLSVYGVRNFVSS